ncbi:MAG: hypothetical protein M1820_007013 [Bogoriella megaspora]|nr:MAG: hypothetical protein M1820_007013 [Bogoriella megaspora]
MSNNCTDCFPDDILSYVGPSLAKHKHCDIIDINPGACLWSAKVHDFLQPRTHLLLEPNYRFFEPIIKPLLDQPSSTYRYAAYDTEDWATYDRIFHDGLLRPEKLSDPNQPNNSLLVVGNFAFSPRKKSFGFESLGTLAIHQFLCQSLRKHSLFHAYGRVRVLLWISEKDLQCVLPRTINHRRWDEFMIETSGFSTLIAGPDIPGAQGAEIKLDKVNTERVARSMLNDDVRLPDARQSEIFKQAWDKMSMDQSKSDGESLPGDKVSSNPKVWLPLQHEYDELEASYRKGEIQTRRVVKKVLSDDPRWSRLLQLRHQHGIFNRSWSKVEPIADACEKLSFLEHEIIAEEEKGADTETLKSNYERQADRLAKLRSNANSLALRTKPDDVVDNRLARQPGNPLLQWDQRPYEPLKVNSTEFHPHESICLLDFQPKTPLIASEWDKTEDGKETLLLLQLLFSHQSSTIAESLNKIVAGGADALIPKCPSITNPTKGGRLNHRDVRVRMLTEEMAGELIKAWLDWPFRPLLSKRPRVGSELRSGKRKK